MTDESLEISTITFIVVFVVVAIAHGIQIFKHKNADSFDTRSHLLIIFCSVFTIFEFICVYLRDLFNDNNDNNNNNQLIKTLSKSFYCFQLISISILLYIYFEFGYHNILLYYRIRHKNETIIPNQFIKFWRYIIYFIITSYFIVILLTALDLVSTLFVLYIFYIVFNIFIVISQIGWFFIMQTLRSPLKFGIQNAANHIHNNSNGSANSANSVNTTHNTANSLRAPNGHRYLVNDNSVSRSNSRQANERRYQRSIITAQREKRKYNLITLFTIITVILTTYNIYNLLFFDYDNTNNNNNDKNNEKVSNSFDYYKTIDINDRPIHNNISFLSQFSLIICILIEFTVYFWYFPKVEIPRQSNTLHGSSNTGTGAAGLVSPTSRTSNIRFFTQKLKIGPRISQTTPITPTTTDNNNNTNNTTQKETKLTTDAKNITKNLKNTNKNGPNSAKNSANTTNNTHNTANTEALKDDTTAPGAPVRKKSVTNTQTGRHTPHASFSWFRRGTVSKSAFAVSMAHAAGYGTDDDNQLEEIVLHNVNNRNNRNDSVGGGKAGELEKRSIYGRKRVNKTHMTEEEKKDAVDAYMKDIEMHNSEVGKEVELGQMSGLDDVMQGLDSNFKQMTRNVSKKTINNIIRHNRTVTELDEMMYEMVNKRGLKNRSGNNSVDESSEEDSVGSGENNANNGDIYYDSNDNNSDKNGARGKKQKKQKRKKDTSLIIYEFDNVIGTLSNKLDKMEYDEVNMEYNYDNVFDVNSEAYDPDRLSLMFGGWDRVELLQEHLGNMLINVANENNGSGGDGGHKLFLFSHRNTRFVTYLLDHIGLYPYFRTILKLNNNDYSELSHIIGNDHPLMQENDSKSHLIILKLIRFLEKEHDAVLYVGYDNQTIEHINDIKACYSYQIKTKGMLESDMKKIEEKFHS